MKKISKYIVINNSNKSTKYITNTYIFSPPSEKICCSCNNILKYKYCEYCNISYFISKEYYTTFVNDILLEIFADNDFKNVYK